MFVSSYNTYISTNSTDRSQRIGVSDSKKSDYSSASKYVDSPIVESKIAKNIPISYISNYKAFNNKQRLLQQFNNPDGERFSKINTQQNMKTAYAENSKVFSLVQQPGLTLNQLNKIDAKLPKNIQELKDENMRRTMINAYISNDRYFDITA